MTTTTDTSTHPGKQLYKVEDAMLILSLSRSGSTSSCDPGASARSRKAARGRIPASAIADYVALLEHEAGQS